MSRVFELAWTQDKGELECLEPAVRRMSDRLLMVSLAQHSNCDKKM